MKEIRGCGEAWTTSRSSQNRIVYSDDTKHNLHGFLCESRGCLHTFVTIVHLQIGHFFSDGFPRWYMLGLGLSEVIHAWSLQCLIISIWGSSRLVWLFLLCILRPLSDLKAFPQMWHLKVSSPCCGSPSSGSTQLSGDTYRSRVFPSH